MMDSIKNFIRPARIREHAEEREKMARLEVAETEVKDLQERGERAVQFLLARDKRNHWQESISRMIQGVQ